MRDRLIIDQVLMLCRLARVPLIGSIVIGAVCAWLMTQWAPASAAAAWYVALVAASVYRAQLAASFLARRPHTAAGARRAANLMLAAAAVSGLLWASATIWLFPEEPTQRLVLGLFFVAALSSGIATLSPVPYGYAALIVPFMIPFAGYQLALGGERTVLGVGAVFFALIMLYISRVYRVGLQEVLSLRIANESLASQLSGEKDEIAQRNSDLQRQIIERERIEAQLIAAKTEAETASRAKSQFLANMSHEVRTPMNAMLGMTELLMRTQLDPKQRRFAQAAFDSGQRLLRLIDDILDLARIEAGKLKLGEVEFSPRVVLQEVVELMTPQTTAKGLSIAEHVASDVPQRVSGDPDRLRQVLVNLISNAVKFTERGSVSVELRLASQLPADEGSTGLRWIVSDTGIGVPLDAQARLFQPFSQADDSTTRRYGGTGLGLAISRQVIEAMGGRIGYEPRAEGGSCFWFELPLAAVASSADASGGDSIAPARGYAGRVLVVEDHAVNRELLHEMLSLLGLTVRVAENGSQALAIMEHEAFDLVLMDWHMPEMDGLEAARRVRANEQARSRGARTRIVALTASAMAGDRETCLAAGMDDYISKPYTHDDIVATLERWLPRPAAARVA